MGWGSSWDKPISLGVDMGVDLASGLDIGKNVEFQIPINGWVTKTVKAIQVGDLAVVSFTEDFDWCIVHVPTLTRFDNALPDSD